MGDDLMCFITKKWITLNSESHPSRGVGFSKKPQPALPTARDRFPLRRGTFTSMI